MTRLRSLILLSLLSTGCRGTFGAYDPSIPTGIIGTHRNQSAPLDAGVDR